MVDAVLKSSMGRMRRRSRMCRKQVRERLDMWFEKEIWVKSYTKVADRGVGDKSMR